MQFKNSKITYVSIGLLIIIIIFTINLIRYSSENQKLKYELSELSGIQYGLLNINEWEVKISSILLEKIEEFELSPKNRNNFANTLEGVLYTIIDEVEKLMEVRTAGGFSGIKKWAAGLALDIDQLRDSVPELSQQIIAELNKPETKKMMKKYLVSKLHEFAENTHNGEEMALADSIVVKYGCISKTECKDLLEIKVKNNDTIINFNVISIIIIVTAIFSILIFPFSRINKTKVTILILSALCLLLGGLLTPMIDLEARIDLLRFQLMGSDVVFADQVFFFQSKSITDVVRILITDGTFQMALVAILVFSFSIIFPTLKLMSSFIYYTMESNIKNNIFVKFFALKSGKWSMADVLVVAIFMSYISLNGVIDNQLNTMTEAAKPVEIIATNGTALLGGFYLFFFFCIYGLVISQVISKSK